MRIIDVSQMSVFGRENIDQESETVKQFIAGLRNLASSLKGRLSKVEILDRTVRISIRNDDVHTGITAYLRKHGIEPVEVDILAEFFTKHSTVAETK